MADKKAGFGTFPVFITTLTTILGAILFLRFGWAVGNVGFINTMLIVILGHLITIPTAFAVAEIATNQKVQGGGAYFIISRSFGLRIGASIGIALYLSQAISIAFYVIAFAEAFQPILDSLNLDITIPDNRYISIPAIALLAILMLTRGANTGMKFLYLIALILIVSIVLFFIGKADNPPEKFEFTARILNGEDFFYVFTIIFPAFTGLAAGLGLSGDLRNPSKSIPQGTLFATIVGLVVYALAAYKFNVSASPADLADLEADQMVMQKIAKFGIMVPIGLAAATISSALGSVMVAPRTLQAIGLDNIFPNKYINQWLAKGKKGNNEPINASMVSLVIAFVFVGIGELDMVARIISMFFIVTYGAICAISVLEAFAADPSYRPTFKSKWYISLLGAVLSFWIMFKMDWIYASIALVIMALIYWMVRAASAMEKKGLVKLLQGVVFQMSRELQIFAQRTEKSEKLNWRPFTVAISSESFKRTSAFDMLRWISYKYGFGTYIHFIEGYLSKTSHEEAEVVFRDLMDIAKGSKSNVYLDTLISPSYTSAIAQVVQLPGISGRGNNMILFEFSRSQPESLNEVLKNYSLLQTTGFDVCILNTYYKGFGYKKNIHIWITSQDYANANLMILLGYIILGHPEWSNGVIKIFALYKPDEIEEKSKNLKSIIKSGRLPISMSNVEILACEPDVGNKSIITKHSSNADLTIVGFRSELIKPKGIELFNGFKDDMGNILFVNSNEEKEIV